MAVVRGRGRALVLVGWPELVGNDGVALHHVARHVLVAEVRGVRDDLPAIRCRQPRGLVHRGVVIAGDAHNFGTQGGNRGFALWADLGMQHDDTAAAHTLGRRCQRPAVVAIGGTDHHPVLELRRVLAGQQVGRQKTRGRPVAQEQSQQRHGSPQHLEAGQGRPARLVLQTDLRQPELPGQTGQRPHRRGAAELLGPAPQPAPALGCFVDIEQLTQRRGVGTAHSVRVGQQHSALRWVQCAQFSHSVKNTALHCRHAEF